MIAVFAIAAALITALLLLWRLQERILFQPPPLSEPAPETGRVAYDALDGQRLMGYLIGDPRSARGVLLCFHGNADLSAWQIEWARLVQRHSEFAVFLAEYRGYMSLGGIPTYQTTKLDARAAYDYLRITLGVERSRLAYFGHSLGSAIATELAEVHPPVALILQSPFTSARAMARLIATPAVTLAWRAISRIHFDTPRAVAELDVPVSVAHGRRDRIVPFRMGLEVFQAARHKGELLIVDGAGHNDVAETAGAEYWQWLARCLHRMGHPPLV
ncbi:MAG TPA: alpha/beta hydrolase [Gemmatimonadaceae bacterium]|jgi:pimeloyl-ACP methyl ester carboxylesterase|nr:alpha/beta hydrolase [Gemmatimonadaceae bacterium]